MKGWANSNCTYCGEPGPGIGSETKVSFFPSKSSAGLGAGALVVTFGESDFMLTSSPPGVRTASTAMSR